MKTGQEIFNYIGIDMGWVLIGAVTSCLLMFVLIIILFMQNNKLKKSYDTFMAGEDGKSLEEILRERFDEVDDLKEDIKGIDKHLEKIDGILLNTYTKMALLRYDAFQEMGGNLSFIIVLLTSSNNGFIINSVHSTREGCYIYGKKIVNGECEIELSLEEKEALEEAKKN